MSSGDDKQQRQPDAWRTAVQMLVDDWERQPRQIDSKWVAIALRKVVDEHAELSHEGTPSDKAMNWAKSVRTTGFANGYVADDHSWEAAAELLRLFEHAAPSSVAPTAISLLRWCVEHDGECLGDHPAKLAEARAALASNSCDREQQTLATEYTGDVQSAPSSTRRSELADVLERLERKATIGPWAWDQRGEKINEWALGVAFDHSDKPLRGRFTDEDAQYVEQVCNTEGATVNYADPDLICELRNNLPEIIAALRSVAVSAIAPRILGIDKARPGGDYTGYACSCGQIRVETDGPCERKDCPIRTTDGKATEV
jgi:hypothetical protein